jgi:hypothetical protein
MTTRIHRIRPSHVLSIAFLSAAVLAGSAIEARAACMVPGASKISALTSATAKLARPGTAPALAAAQDANSNGGGPIVGLWQFVITDSQLGVIDFGFQHFHSDGTEFISSGGLPPTLGNVCVGAWERSANGEIRLVHVGWNFAGDEVLGDPPTGYFYLEATLRTNSQGAAYSGTFRAASFNLGAGPLGSGGPAQPNSEFEGTLHAVKISVP